MSDAGRPEGGSADQDRSAGQDGSADQDGAARQDEATPTDDRSGAGLPLADPQRAEPEDLSTLADRLLQEATERPHGLRTCPVVRGPLLQSVMFALREGAQLPEHDSPPAATLQVLRGEVVLVAGADRWTLGGGALLPIPPVRHHVDALTDAVCLLTIARP